MSPRLTKLVLCTYSSETVESWTDIEKTVSNSLQTFFCSSSIRGRRWFFINSTSSVSTTWVSIWCGSTPRRSSTISTLRLWFPARAYLLFCCFVFVTVVEGVRVERVSHQGSARRRRRGGPSDAQGPGGRSRRLSLWDPHLVLQTESTEGSPKTTSEFKPLVSRPYWLEWNWTPCSFTYTLFIY